MFEHVAGLVAKGQVRWEGVGSVYEDDDEVCQRL